jgi:hypothetical protein
MTVILSKGMKVFNDEILSDEYPTQDTVSVSTGVDQTTANSVSQYIRRA